MMDHAITLGDLLTTGSIAAIAMAIVCGIACLGVDQGWWG